MTDWYHGTNYDFEKFESRHLGKACKNPTTEFGFFFTECSEDALSWALREQERSSAIPRNAQVLSVDLNVKNTKEISYRKFLFYLQKAKTSTIQRDRKKWIEEGFDSMTVVREGKRWMVPFNTDLISIKEVLKVQPRVEESENLKKGPSLKR